MRTSPRILRGNVSRRREACQAGLVPRGPTHAHMVCYGFVAFLWQIPPFRPVLPVFPTRKLFAVNNLRHDSHLHTVDFRLSDRRNVAAAKAFFKKAIRHQGHAPHTITLDGYAASHRAVREMQNADMLPKSTQLRSSKYLNNLVEQDHRGIKSRTGPMLGFKNFNSAAITLAGVELLHRIRKGQFALSRLQLKDQAVPAIWNAVLAA